MSSQLTPLYAYAGNNLFYGKRMSEKVHTEGFHQQKDAMPKAHQWPWRGFAFASDLGIVAQLLQKPILGSIGWLIALPYYAYSILSQKNTRKRKREGVYQFYANGLFPFLEAKLGLSSGKRIATYYKLTGKTQGFMKVGCASLALMTLTPLVADPISQIIMKRYDKRHSLTLAA